MKDLSSLSIDIDKYKELISIGLKSIQSRTYSKYDKILFVGSIAVPFLVNLPIYGIIPNNRDKRIETIYDNAIAKINIVYEEVETLTTNTIFENQDIKDMAAFAEKSNKLCRILGQRDVVLMLLRIIFCAEEMFENSYSHRLPLTEATIHQLYTSLDTENIMLHSTDLLNHILPWVSDIPFDLFYTVIHYHLTSPSSYQLICSVLRTMILNHDTIQPFIDVNIISIVKYYLDNQFKYEYSLLQDYWLQLARIIYKAGDQFKTTVDEQSFIDEYYDQGRFKLWLPEELRLPPHSMLYETITDAFGYYFGWVNKTGLLVDQIYSNNLFSEDIYRRLDSTLTRYLGCSIFASSLSLYLIFILQPKGKIYCIASALTTMVLYSFHEQHVNHQRLSGKIYKSFQKYYQTKQYHNDEIELITNQNQNQNNIINNKSDILNYHFK
ncbi:hypothetical protein DFA_08034 [Cavenderia fasciculata]|uniref:Transmembrane protein n=1 Tax=Cavenderia fasciculata TaxID=261658 RepID=F4Q4P4_CACFS|nr:uncharacterized protein DFA_08034 [Cavenderia fasciculata]EGG17053.1 hypothetical protein DFA_08034 [Cavenderia fasciculata]|eukprot:XP_004355537.1 hypothetical protein DFA_08034 [Cavenderia fasciculata]